MFVVREAVDADLPHCAALQGIYTTRTVWQFNPASAATWSRIAVHDAAAAHGLPVVSFRLQQVRLPRLRSLLLPSSIVPLADVWVGYAARLVAWHGEALGGYLCLQALPDQQRTLIARLLVDGAQRGQGVGTALLRAAQAWLQAQDATTLLAHAPLRNVPGIAFYQRRGFQICGLAEHFYPTREDALLLTRDL